LQNGDWKNYENGKKDIVDLRIFVVSELMKNVDQIELAGGVVDDEIIKFN